MRDDPVMVLLNHSVLHMSPDVNSSIIQCPPFLDINPMLTTTNKLIYTLHTDLIYPLTILLPYLALSHLFYLRLIVSYVIADRKSLS